METARLSIDRLRSTSISDLDSLRSHCIGKHPMLTTLHATIRHTRQHHAIEHATLHHAGRSAFPDGAWPATAIRAASPSAGRVPMEAVRRALTDAMLRLQAGESDLAIHPNCGTNLLATGVLVTLPRWSAAAGARRDCLEPLRHARCAGAAGAGRRRRPLGYRACSSYTTLADIGDRWVKDVRPLRTVGGPARVPRITFAVTGELHHDLSASQRRRISRRPADRRAQGALGDPEMAEPEHGRA